MAAPDAVSILIPAYNEGPIVGDVIRTLLAVGPWHEILLVDDGSSDDTAAAAEAAGARVLRHPYNKGNGAAVKTGIRAATGDYIMVIDGDGQHRPDDAQRLVALLGEYDLVVGARAGHTQATGVRRAGNGLLNAFATYMTGRVIPDLTSGFRGARRELLREFLYLIPNGFSTPTTTTLAFIKAGYSVLFVPIEARQRTGSSKIRLARDGTKFLLIILKVVTIFSPMKVFLPVSLGAFTLGVLYAGWTVATSSKIANGSVLLLMFALIVFLVGLVSEQISALRFEGRR
ncbi:MAG: glycosyltransferase family 2 protein [Acidobacteria bacterium]|nr:glycosyltransferase family 2 protein [Acidobacteriota bacterium]